MTETTEAEPQDERRRPRMFAGDAIQPGMAPGLLHVDPSAPPPSISVTAYDQGGVEEGHIESVSEISDWLKRKPVVWINVDGLGDAGVLQQIGDLFGVHRLVLEDVINVHQRPKVEDYGDLMFVVCRMPVSGGTFDSEQVSLIVAPGVLITFQESVGDCLGPVRMRIREGKGRIRGRGSDYLAYAVIDAIVDAYFPVLGELEDRLEVLEEEVVHHAELDTITRIYDAKREIFSLRRVIWPMREMTKILMRDEMPVVTESTRVYLRDCYDHAATLGDIVESYLEAASGLLDVCLSMASHRMNEVMKVLTLIATIFIPLTFIAGIYGMNFDPQASPWNMPELSWYLGYPLCIALMLALGVALLFYFRRLGWIGSVKRPASTRRR